MMAYFKQSYDTAAASKQTPQPTKTTNQEENKTAATEAVVCQEAETKAVSSFPVTASKDAEYDTQDNVTLNDVTDEGKQSLDIKNACATSATHCDDNDRKASETTSKLQEVATSSLECTDLVGSEEAECVDIIEEHVDPKVALLVVKAEK